MNLKKNPLLTGTLILTSSGKLAFVGVSLDRVFFTDFSFPRPLEKKTWGCFS